jgi:hypothetical protein
MAARGLPFFTAGEYVFLKMGDEKGQPQHQIITGLTGYYASLSFVRRLTSEEIDAQPTHYATETTCRQRAVAAPATSQNNNSQSDTPLAPTQPTVPASQHPLKVAIPPLQSPTQ